jgi:archaellin
MELENYIVSMEGKAKNTIKTYVSNYNRLRKHFDKDIVDVPNMELIDHIASLESSNTKNGFVTIAIQIKRLAGKSIIDLNDYRDTLRTNLTMEIKKKNEVLQNILPNYSDIVAYTEGLFDIGQHPDYIINFLLINYNVRNLDLDFQITTKIGDATNEEINYMVLMPNKCMYIRNRYKTSKSYGSKTHKITDERFNFAVRKVYQSIKKSDTDEYINPIIPNPATVGYRVQSATFKALGEGAYAKICIHHFRDDLDTLKRICDNRGTNISTLITDYDIHLIE